MPSTLPLCCLLLCCLAPMAAASATYDQDPWYTVTAPEGWRMKPGQGYVQFDGPKGAFLRLYAIGLRSVGGKYRNLEHAVDDLIFQVRDELGGTVTAKRDIPLVLAGEQAVTARGFDGSYAQGRRSITTRFMVLPHDREGMVLSVQHAGPADGYQQSLAAATAIIGSIVLRQPEADPTE